MVKCCRPHCCGSDSGTRLVSISKEDRHCTDVLGLIGFICSWAIIAVIYANCQARGADVDRIIRAVDFADNICGVTPGYVNQPYGAFPFPWGLEGYQTIICVSDCTETDDPKNTRMSDLYPSEQFLYYCVPVVVSNLSLQLSVSGNFNLNFLQYSEEISRGVGDVWYSRNVIGYSLIVSMIMVLFYCVFLRMCAKTLVYSLLVIVMAFGLMLSQVLLNFAASAATSSAYSPDAINLLRYAGYGFMTVTGLFALIVFALRKQIDIAIEVTREAAKALLDMPAMILFPVIPAAILGAYVVMWVGIGLQMYSVTTASSVPIPAEVRTYTPAWALAGYPTLVGQTNPNIPATTIQRTLDPSTETMAAAHVFHLLLVSQFFFYLGYLIFAGAAADWYFTETNAKGRKKRGTGQGELSHWPVSSSCRRTVCNHMGTVAICALIIAIVKWLRMAIHFVERQTQGKPPNPLQKALFCLIKCFLRCLECCLDKINKNSLSWTAVYGDGFCIAACSSFALVWRNLFRVAALNAVSSVIFWMGKMAVGLCTAALVGAYLTFVEPYASNVTSPLCPCMLVFFMGYILSQLFFVVFSATCDTLFICFLIDSEVNKAGEMMAPKALQKLVGKYEKRSTKEAVEIKELRVERQTDLPPEEKHDLAFKNFDEKSYVKPAEEEHDQDQDDIDG